ncbi:MAG: J domain-containing protein [Pseudomonadota bacterium]
MKRDLTLYDTLEVSPRASPQVIKAAYRALAQRNHPDKKSGCDTACEQQVQLNKAYSVLSDPDQRQRYDQSIKVNEPCIERRGNGTVVRHRSGFLGEQPAMSRPFIFRPLKE